MRYSLDKEKSLVLIIVVLLASSIFFLYQKGSRQLEPGYGDGWWALYFKDEGRNDWRFSISNFQESGDFVWQVESSGRPIKKGKINLDKGQTEEIDPGSIDGNNEKIEIRVTKNGSSKEINK